MNRSNEIILNALPNIDAHISRYPDGEFAAYELYPHPGYVIFDPSGEAAIGVPYYSFGGMSILDEKYNWVDNRDGYEAIQRSTLSPEIIIFGVDPEV